MHGLGPRIREQPIKIHAVNCKMWNRGLEGLLREGNVCREDSPSSLAICFPSVRNTKFNKQTKDRARLLPFPTLFEGRRLSPGTQVKVCLGSELRRGEIRGAPARSLTRVPAAPKRADTQRSSPECELELRVWAKGQLCQLTEARSRAQSLAWTSVWSCLFLKVCNSVFWNSPSVGFGSSVKV